MGIKFKIGDLVKVTTVPIDGSLLRRHGEIVTILKITKTGKYKIDCSRAEYDDEELVRF